MKKTILTERFQQLAGLKPLYTLKENNLDSLIDKYGQKLIDFVIRVDQLTSDEAADVEYLEDRIEIHLEEPEIRQKYLAEGKLLKEVRGPLKMELNIKKGKGIDIDMIMDDYGFEENVDGVPVEDLFDENGFALKDMVIVYDQRDDMYLMDAEDMEKYH
jgi:hypothetical protein